MMIKNSNWIELKFQLQNAPRSRRPTTGRSGAAAHQRTAAAGTATAAAAAGAGVGGGPTSTGCRSRTSRARRDTLRRRAWHVTQRGARDTLRPRCWHVEDGRWAADAWIFVASRQWRHSLDEQWWWWWWWWLWWWWWWSPLYFFTPNSRLLVREQTWKHVRKRKKSEPVLFIEKGKERTEKKLTWAAISLRQTNKTLVLLLLALLVMQRRNSPNSSLFPAIVEIKLSRKDSLSWSTMTKHLKNLSILYRRDSTCNALQVLVPVSIRCR